MADGLPFVRATTGEPPRARGGRIATTSEALAFERLTGPQKAAILMLALREEHAAKLFQRMEIDEVKDISQVMASLGKVTSEIVEKLLREFGDRLSSSGTLIGTFETTERMLARFLSKEQVEAIMEDIRGPAGRTVWDKLGNVNEGVLASYLKNEYPQTVAVVLSRIRPDHAARVLANLPEDFAVEVMMRMLRLQVVQREVLNDVEKTLRTDFMSNLARTQRRDNHEAMAEVFNHLDRGTETRFLSLLEERNRESAEKIRTLMFTFEDLARLDAAAIQTLLRNASGDRVAKALKGASESLRQLFFSNMSERAAKILREDMEAMGPVRLRDVEEAQNTLVETAKRLAAGGEIVLADGKDDELVY